MTDNALIILESGNPKELFAINGLDEFINKIREEVADSPKDVSTESGRKAIASLAYKVAKSKIALEKLGKESIEDLQKTVKAVIAERIRGVNALQEIQDEIRKPLTEWENAEKERVEKHEANISEIIKGGEFTLANWQTLGVSLMDERLAEIIGDKQDWQEFKLRAENEIQKAIDRIKTAILMRKTYDAEQAELARLRAEQVAREQKEREDKIALEAAEKARLEAEAKAKLEAERAEREKQEAISRAEKAEADRILAENNAILAAKIAEGIAERNKIEAVAAEKKRHDDEAARIKAETEKREADTKHKAKINNEALKALGALPNMNEGVAKSIVEAIAKGLIPHIRINY
jgi:peptidoglycan DL-endopeptidase RipA